MSRFAKNIPLNHTCGGNGTCGTCLIHVLKGLENLEPRNEIEAEMAADRGFTESERLACQILPRTDLTVEIKNED